MNKNRSGDKRRRTSRRMIAKLLSIKGTGYRSGGRVLKLAELTSEDMPLV